MEGPQSREEPRSWRWALALDLITSLHSHRRGSTCCEGAGGLLVQITRWPFPSCRKGQTLPASLSLLGLIYAAYLPFGIWNMSLMSWCLLRPHGCCHLLPAATVPLLRGHRCHHPHPQWSHCPSQLRGRASRWHCGLGHPGFWGVKPEELPCAHTSFETNAKYLKPDS